jgi:aspartyl-tRNA(Asn)/glutamyl-tRNA(Gln) amidotransferase subunit A
MTEAHRDYPRLFPRPEQMIAGIGRAIREGRMSCVDVLSRCFEQVDEWEPKVHAWVVLDRYGALAQARALDEELKAGNDRGPLHGIPVGIKDIIDVKGLPTACGAKRWVGRIAERDAYVVGRLRRAGAVMMGKTVTTPYAWIDPPVTRNPWNLERTPGGSSSGSAAAVACGMCFGAIGTQTGGSITRPASFCGVAGMKPSRMSTGFWKYGVQPFAPSLDHVGPIARTVDDLRLLFMAMSEQKPLVRDDHVPRYGRFRGFFDRRAAPASRAGLDEAVHALAAEGAEIVELDDPVDFEQILQDHRKIMAAVAAAVHSDLLDSSPEDYPPHIRALILEGRSVTAPEYLKARDDRRKQAKSEITMMWALHGKGVRDLITPATVGTAPDPSTTGDPAFNSPWSFTGLPTVSFPIGLSDDGLPVAIQIVGRKLADQLLLRTAAWCEQAIRTRRQ